MSQAIPPAKILQDADRELLYLLTRRVGMVSLAQVARTWHSGKRDPQRAAKRQVAKLEAAELLAGIKPLVHPELPLKDPITTWQPGLPVPVLADIARDHPRRWQSPETEQPCMVATEAAGREFGGTGGRFPGRSEVTHDLHLTSVYLLMRRELPARAESWVGEAQLHGGQGTKVPDAMVRDGRKRTAIEFVGQSYGLEKLREFHDYCADRGIGYELW